MIPTPWQWQFPKYALQANLIAQIAYIFSETVEVRDAYWEESGERTAEELMDVIHAAETALRILESQGVDLDAVKRGVIEKNDGRGYYGGAE